MVLAGEHLQVLARLLAQLGDALVEVVAQLLHAREDVNGAREHVQRVAHLHVLLGLEALHERLEDLAVPLEDDLDVLLVRGLLRVLVGEADREAGQLSALFLVDVLVRLPVEQLRERGVEEVAEVLGLPLRAAEGMHRDVAQQLVVVLQRREHRRAERVHVLHELGAVDGVARREDAPREDAGLQEVVDRLGATAALLAEPAAVALLEACHDQLVVRRLLLQLALELVLVGEAALLVLLALDCRGLLVLVRVAHAKRRLVAVDLLHLPPQPLDLALVPLLGHEDVVEREAPEGVVQVGREQLPARRGQHVTDLLCLLRRWRRLRLLRRPLHLEGKLVVLAFGRRLGRRRRRCRRCRRRRGVERAERGARDEESDLRLELVPAAQLAHRGQQLRVLGGRHLRGQEGLELVERLLAAVVELAEHLEVRRVRRVRACRALLRDEQKERHHKLVLDQRILPHRGWVAAWVPMGCPWVPGGAAARSAWGGAAASAHWGCGASACLEARRGLLGVLGDAQQVGHNVAQRLATGLREQLLVRDVLEDLDARHLGDEVAQQQQLQRLAALERVGDVLQQADKLDRRVLLVEVAAEARERGHPQRHVEAVLLEPILAGRRELRQHDVGEHVEAHRRGILEHVDDGHDHVVVALHLAEDGLEDGERVGVRHLAEMAAVLLGVVLGEAAQHALGRVAGGRLDHGELGRRVLVHLGGEHAVAAVARRVRQQVEQPPQLVH